MKKTDKGEAASTMQRFDESCLTPIEKLTPEQIKAIREEEYMSVAVFARHLWVSASLVEKWESGNSVPKGANLKLLTLVKNKGLDCIA